MNDKLTTIQVWVTPDSGGEDVSAFRSAYPHCWPLGSTWHWLSFQINFNDVNLFQSQHGRSDKPGRHSPWKAKPCPLIQLAMPRYDCIVVIMHMCVHMYVIVHVYCAGFTNPLSGFRFSFWGGGTLHAAVPREAYPWALLVPRLRFHTMVPCDVSLNNQHATNVILDSGSSIWK